jgi:Lon protease-like protein
MPLFPLNSVLFPNMLMALHIFEDRYREMMSECIERDGPFGVVLLRTGNEVGDDEAEPYLVGTAAVIRDVDRLANGRMNIVAQGTDRFRIRQFDSSRSFLVGKVQPVEDQPWCGYEDEAEVLEEAKSTFKQLADLLTERLDLKIQVRFSADPCSLSFAMAGMLGIDQRVRQHLLEVTDTAERFAEMVPLMQEIVKSVSTQPHLRKSHYSEIKDWMLPN